LNELGLPYNDNDVDEIESGEIGDDNNNEEDS